MEWVEVTGRSVEEAKEAALDQLVFDNAVNLYKIPVTLPRQQTLAAK